MVILAGIVVPTILALIIVWLLGVQFARLAEANARLEREVQEVRADIAGETQALYTGPRFQMWSWAQPGFLQQHTAA